MPDKIVATVFWLLSYYGATIALGPAPWCGEPPCAVHGNPITHGSCAPAPP